MKLTKEMESLLRKYSKLIAEGKIREVCEYLPQEMRGKFMDLLISSKVDIWEYLGKDIPASCFTFSSVKTLEIPLSIKRIGEYAFSGAEIREISIPDTVNEIYLGAFEYCVSLKKIKLPYNLTEIGQQLFMNCDELTTVILPENLNRIKDFAFLGCTKLNSVNIPASLESIGDMAFTSCEKLHQINYSGTGEQWKKINKAPKWRINSGISVIKCADGEIKL